MYDLSPGDDKDEVTDYPQLPLASDDLPRQSASEGAGELQRLRPQNQSSEQLLQGQLQEQQRSPQSTELRAQTAVVLPSAASPDTTAKNIPDDDWKLSFKDFTERHPDKNISRMAWTKSRKDLSISSSRTASNAINNIPDNDWQLSFKDFTERHSDKNISKSAWQIRRKDLSIGSSRTASNAIKNVPGGDWKLSFKDFTERHPDKNISKRAWTKSRKDLGISSSITAPDTIKNIPDDDWQLSFKDFTEKHRNKTISNSTWLAHRENRKKYESYPSEDKVGTYAYNEAVTDQSDKKLSHDNLVRIKRLANEGKINLDNMTGESFDILSGNDQALMKRFFSYLPSNAFEVLEKRLGTSRVKQQKSGRGSQKGWKKKSTEERLAEFIDVSKGFGVLGASGAGAESGMAGSMMSHPPTVPPQLQDVEGIQNSRGVSFVIESGEPESGLIKKRKRKSTTRQSYPAGGNPPRPDVPGMFAADPSSSIFNLFFPDSQMFDVISFSGSPSGADMTTFTYTGPDERKYYSGFIDKDNNVRVNPQPQAPNFSRVREALQAALPEASLGFSGDLDTEMHDVVSSGPSSSLPSAAPSFYEGTLERGVLGKPFSKYSRSEVGSSGVRPPKTGISDLMSGVGIRAGESATSEIREGRESIYVAPSEHYTLLLKNMNAIRQIDPSYHNNSAYIENQSEMIKLLLPAKNDKTNEAKEQALRIVKENINNDSELCLILNECIYLAVGTHAKPIPVPGKLTRPEPSAVQAATTGRQMPISGASITSEDANMAESLLSFASGGPSAVPPRSRASPMPAALQPRFADASEGSLQSPDAQFGWAQPGQAPLSSARLEPMGGPHPTMRPSDPTKGMEPPSQPSNSKGR
jgi:hypothetical protein